MATARSIDRKLSRGRDHRRLLIRNLATDLVLHKSITTTVPKAKVLVPYIERLVSRGRRGGLHARRYVRARLDTVEATHELVDVISAQSKRDSGHVRLVRAGTRAGDNAPLATVSFVDTFNQDSPATTTSPKPAAKKKSSKTDTSSSKPKSATAKTTAKSKATAKAKSTSAAKPKKSKE